MFPAVVAANSNRFSLSCIFLCLMWSWWSSLTHLDICLRDLLHSCTQVFSSTFQMFFRQPLPCTGLPSFSRLHTITELTDEGIFILFFPQPHVGLLYWRCCYLGLHHPKCKWIDNNEIQNRWSEHPLFFFHLVRKNKKKILQIWAGMDADAFKL